MIYREVVKPLSDFLISLFTLILISPLLLCISIVLFLHFKSTPFFIQSRPGINGRIFKLVKFKSMKDLFDKEDKLLPDEDRITRLGNFVRRTSLDELPQLFNVLKGDLSIIGPRPLIPEYLPLYSKEQFRRHDVKPGITGWAQVNGRNSISWKQKFELDIYYVDNISFKLDMKILYLTLWRVIRKEGINKEGCMTTQAFNGNN